MQEETSIMNDIAQAFIKGFGLISGITYALFAKVGVALMTKQRYTFSQWVGIFLVSAFCGKMTHMMCIANNWNTLIEWAPSVSTLFAHQLVQYVVADYKRILRGLVDLIFRGKK